MLNLIKKLFNLPERIEITSISPNPKVQRVNYIIADNEEKDGEFWISIGNQELINILKDFSATDLQDLQNDIINWTSQQQTILADSLVTENFTTHDVCSLYGNIFLHVNDEDAGYLIQNLGFINNCGQENTQFIAAIIARIETISTLNPNIKDRYINLVKEFK